jgi:hypothetical protein
MFLTHRTPGAGLKSGRRISLGTVNTDIEGLEVVRYKAPIILVKPVDTAGNVIEGVKPEASFHDPGKTEITGEHRNAGPIFSTILNTSGSFCNPLSEKLMIDKIRYSVLIHSWLQFRELRDC